MITFKLVIISRIIRIIMSLLISRCSKIKMIQLKTIIILLYDIILAKDLHCNGYGDDGFEHVSPIYITKIIVVSETLERTEENS